VFTTPASALKSGGPEVVVTADASESAEVAALRITLRNANSREARGAARSELLKQLHPGSNDESAEKAAQLATLEKQLAGATSELLKADLKRQISRLKTVAASLEKSERPKLIGTLTDVFPVGMLTAQPGRAATNGVMLAIPEDGELLTAFTAPVVGSGNDESREQLGNLPAQLWVWDIETQTLLRHWDDLPASIGSVMGLAATNQVVSSDGHAFSLPSGQARSFAHSALDRISAFAVSPAGNHLAVGFVGAAKSTSKVLRLLDAASLQEEQSHEAFESLITAVTFAPDGASLAVAVRERQVHRVLVLDATTLAVQATIEEIPHDLPWLQGGLGESRDRGLTTLLFSADGRFLLTHGFYAASDYRLTLWQKKGNKWSKETGINSKASQPIIDDSRSPAPVWFIAGKGSQLAAITAKGLGIVETSNGKLLRSIELRDGTKQRNPLAWSADGTWLAQGDDAGNVTLWTLRTNKEAATFPSQLGPIKAIALSQDGRLLTTLGEENRLHLWNLDGWQPKNRVAAKPKTIKPATTSD
jgi:WD40 repeat protein